MKIELANGTTLGYDDSGGTGTALVLLHGFPLDRTIWAAQMHGLADAARVIAPDLRGFGESSGPRRADPGPAVTMDDYAADVAALLDALGIGTAVVGGVSMGGYVAMAFRHRYPERLAGLILVDTRGDADSDDARRARDAMAATARTEGAAAVASLMIGKMLTPGAAGAEDPRRVALSNLMGAQTVEAVTDALLAIRDRPDSRASLARTEVPVLIVCGEEDALIPPSEARSLRDVIPGSRLRVVPAAAHLPNLEQPEAFDRIVRAFVTPLA